MDSYFVTKRSAEISGAAFGPIHDLKRAVATGQCKSKLCPDYVAPCAIIRNLQHKNGAHKANNSKLRCNLCDVLYYYKNNSSNIKLLYQNNATLLYQLCKVKKVSELFQHNIIVEAQKSKMRLMNYGIGQFV